MEMYMKKNRNGDIDNSADTQRDFVWKAEQVNGLIRTVLLDDYIPPIILTEEESSQLHIADGGQRTAALRQFRYGNYKITSAIEDSIIPYKQKIKNEDGTYSFEDANCDIKGKTYETLPPELQKIFDEYQLETVIHEHCDSEKTAKYIKIYNQQISMNNNQKAYTYIYNFAGIINKIVENRFFIEYSDFSDNEKNKAVRERAIMESVMCMFHFEKWNKNTKKIAQFLNDNASKDEFDKLLDNIDRLNNVITDTTKILFNSKDCFIWLTLFDKFTQYGLNDAKFGEFLDAFVNELKDKPVDEKLFYTADEKGSTKDKSVIVDKLHILETLMKEFLHIEEVEEVKDILKFVKKNVNPYITEEDIELYSDILDGLTLEVDNNTKLLNEDNRPSLLALVGYACKNDIDLDDWIKQWFISNTTYLLDQRKNYEIMKDNLSKYMYEKGGNLYRRSMERYQ